MARKIYVIRNLKTREVHTSFMVKPLADKVGCDRRTVKNWIEKPAIAEKKNYEVVVGKHLTGLKGKDDD
jgi:hypothetical protein